MANCLLFLRLAVDDLVEYLFPEFVEVIRVAVLCYERCAFLLAWISLLEVQLDLLWDLELLQFLQLFEYLLLMVDLLHDLVVIALSSLLCLASLPRVRDLFLGSIALAVRVLQVRRRLNCWRVGPIECCLDERRWVLVVVVCWSFATDALDAHWRSNGLPKMRPGWCCERWWHVLLVLPLVFFVIVLRKRESRVLHPGRRINRG